MKKCFIDIQVLTVLYEYIEIISGINCFGCIKFQHLFKLFTTFICFHLEELDIHTCLDLFRLYPQRVKLHSH